MNEQNCSVEAIQYNPKICHFEEMLSTLSTVIWHKAGSMVGFKFEIKNVHHLLLDLSDVNLNFL